MQIQVWVRHQETGDRWQTVFDAKEVTFGGDPSCQVRLGGPDVSDRHLRLVLRDGKLIVVDLKSKTGVFVVDKTIDPPPEPRPLRAPEVVRPRRVYRAGPYELRFALLDKVTDWPMSAVGPRRAVGDWLELETWRPARGRALGLYARAHDPADLALGMSCTGEEGSAWATARRASPDEIEPEGVLEELGWLETDRTRVPIALFGFVPSVSVHAVAAASRHELGRPPLEALTALGGQLARIFRSLPARSTRWVYLGVVAPRVLVDFEGRCHLWPGPHLGRDEEVARYVAPERRTSEQRRQWRWQARIFDPADRAAVVWSIATLMLSLQTGAAPFPPDPRWPRPGQLPFRPSRLPLTTQAEGALDALPATTRDVLHRCLQIDIEIRPSLEELAFAWKPQPEALAGWVAGLLPDERARQERFVDEVAMIDPATSGGAGS